MSSQLRIASGSLDTAFWSRTVPTAAWLVLSRTVASDTVTLSTSDPTASVKSRRARWPVSRLSDWPLFSNPAASAVTT